MTKCDTCGHEAEEPKGYKRNFCDSCISDKEIGIGVVHEREFIEGYGYVLKSRIAEMAKRVIIDDKHSKTDYFVGSYERGKIREKEPDYSG